MLVSGCLESMCHKFNSQGLGLRILELMIASPKSRGFNSRVPLRSRVSGSSGFGSQVLILDCRFACIKSLNRYNLRHNSCVIFSIFLCFKYSFLSNSFIYKFVHAIIFLFIERKAISCLSVELSKIYQYWSCLIIL